MKSSKNLKTLLISLLVVVAIALPIGLVVNYYNTPGKYDELAQCIKDKGAVFYGAFWCPHCQNQKATFGKSAKLLPYTECSTPDGQGQMAVCTDAGVESYPTWKFADGSTLSGEQSIEILAEKTACELNI
jgi:thiol-disulfide isomerase/thioredoxin